MSSPLDTVRTMTHSGGMQYRDAQLATVGDNIRRLRELHWTQEEFAELVGMSRSHLAYIEGGRRAHPRRYQRIADALGVTPDELAVRPTSKRGAA